MPNYLKKYSLYFRSLSQGLHQFKYIADDKFFDFFPDSEVKQGKVLIKVNITVQTSNLILEILMKGTVKMQCDLCLDEFDLPIKYKANLFVDFGEISSDLTDIDEKLTLAFSENEIDLSQHFYEYIHLSLPTRRVHKKDENGKSRCNQEMIEKIKQFTINAQQEEVIDPRWEELKKLNN